MTEELKPHQIAQLVNKLRDIATKYHAHGCLRELISREVNAALTQRPAAQAGEREAFEAFEAWATSVGYHTERDMFQRDKYQSTVTWELWRVWQASASLPTQPAAQESAAVKTLERMGYTYHGAELWKPPLGSITLPAAQATPEPVGEPFGYFRALPFGWEQCGEHDDGAVALYDHPAPGVPEGFVMVPVEPTQAMLDALHSSAYLPGCYRAMLAAAQAKGDAHD